MSNRNTRYNTYQQSRGGSLFSKPKEDDKDEDTYRYKAKKYHYKIQHKLKQMQSEGKSIPQGYEIYLQPFQS